MITSFGPNSPPIVARHHGRTSTISKIFLLGVLTFLIGIGCGDGSGADTSKLQQALQEFLAPTGTIQVQVLDGITPTLINEAKADIADIVGLDFLPGTTLAALQVPEISSKCTASPCVSGDACLGAWTNWSVNFECLCEHSGHCVGSGELTQTTDGNIAGDYQSGAVTLHYNKVRYSGATSTFRADGEAVFAISGCDDSGNKAQSFKMEWFDLLWNEKAFRGGRKYLNSVTHPEVLVYTPDGSYVLVETPTGVGMESQIAIRGADGIADCTFNGTTCGVCVGRSQSGQWSVCVEP